MNKKFYSIAAAAALLGLASCSSDDVINDVNPGDLTKGENYMAFTISNVGDNSRAANDTNTENAVGTEGDLSANDVRFYFYDVNGNPFTFLANANVNPNADENMVQPSEIVQTTNSMGAAVKTGVLVLGQGTGKGYVGTTPSYVLCVANASDNEYAALKGKTLAVATAETTNWTATSTSKFMMTSATWVKNGKVTIADDNIQSYVATTPDAAKLNPININIERLAAKVRATYSESFDVKVTAVGETNFVVDNQNVTFSLAINGWQLQKTATQSNSFKQLTDAQAAWDWVNDATNKRSFWAETTPGALANTTYDIYTENFGYKSYNSNNPTENIAYCYENTTDASNESFKVFDRTNERATAIVVKGTLSMKVGDTTEANIDLCKWFGNYYRYATLVNMIKDSYNKANNSNYTEVRFKDNVEEDNSYKAQIKIGTGDEDANWTDVPNFGNILWWKAGVTSYYLNIEHNTNLLGVVRNHIYDYTFDGIVGLGFPGNEKTLPKDEETFVAAHLNVLNWNVVKNTITLE